MKRGKIGRQILVVVEHFRKVSQFYSHRLWQYKLHTEALNKLPKTVQNAKAITQFMKSSEASDNLVELQLGPGNKHDHYAALKSIKL